MGPLTHPAILESDVPDSALLTRVAVGRAVWTTADEIRWMESLPPRLWPLLAKANLTRSWDGLGMRVDGDAVRVRLEWLIRMKGGR